MRAAAWGGIVASSALLALASMTGASASERVAGAASTVEIKIGDNFFRPARRTVAAGTTVRWSNVGRNVHNVVANRGNRFGVDDLAGRESYRHRFTRPGRYAYYCSFHGAPGIGQHGVIRVVEADVTSKVKAGDETYRGDG